MMLTLSWYNDADKDVERALQHDLAEEAARKSQAIEAANRVIESWVLRNGGRILNEDGTKGSAEIPAEHLEDLPDIIKQVEETCESRFHVGIGSEPSEAITALKVAEKRGKVTLYTPDISDEAAEESEEDPLEMSDMSKAAQQNFGAQFNEPGEPREATRIMQGELTPNAAAPSPPASASFAAPRQPGQEQQPQGQPGAPQNEDQLMNAIGGVLQDMKAQIPFFEEQVKKANPQAYQAVMGLVEAMVELAKQVAGGGADQPHPEEGQQSQEQQEQQVQKAEKVELEPPQRLAKPPVSEAQRRLVHARAAEGEGWAKEWAAADKGGKLPARKAEADDKGIPCKECQGGSMTPTAGESVQRLDATYVPHRCNKCGHKDYHPYRPSHAKGEVDPSRLKTGAAEESSEHGLPPGGKKVTGKDIARDHLEEDPTYYAKGETGEKGHKYPVGTHKQGKVKVIEPATGKTSWHSARAGQKQSGDGHAVSARLGECPSAATPQNPRPGSGGPTQEARDPTMSDAGKR